MLKPWRSTKRKVVSPKGVVMEKVDSVPPLSVNVSISWMGVPPRSSSSLNVFFTSSTSKARVPMPSGCFFRKRAARPPSPSGAEQITLQSPARYRIDRCLPLFVSSGVLSPISAKSIISQ